MMAAARAGTLVRTIGLAVLLALLAACGSSPNKPGKPGTRASSGSSRGTAGAPGRPGRRSVNDDTSRSQSSRYGVNQDSVPDDGLDVSTLVEPTPKVEPRSLYGNKSPYSVLGKSYTVLPNSSGYVERGIASFYGSKFHGYKTSNFEEYDMYEFSAAHKTLPLPSYARVTNLENGKSVIVRINDRGPFHENRIIDLSYAAAVKIGVWPKGTGLVEVRSIDPEHPDNAPPAPVAAVNPARATPTLPVPAPMKSLPPAQAQTTADLDPATHPMASQPYSTALPPPLPVSGATPAMRPASTPGTPGVASGLPASRGSSTPVSPLSASGSAAVTPSATATSLAGASRPPASSMATSGKPAMRPPSNAITLGAALPPDLPPQSPPPPALPVIGPKPTIYLQVGAFSDLANASRVVDQLNKAGLGPASIIESQVNGKSVRRVRVGPLPDVDTADRLTERIAGMGLPRPQVAVD